MFDKSVIRDGLLNCKCHFTFDVCQLFLIPVKKICLDNFGHHSKVNQIYYSYDLLKWTSPKSDCHANAVTTYGTHNKVT